MQTTTSSFRATPLRRTPEAPSLPAMAKLSVDALGALYAGGTPPRLRDLDGAPRGRMLTWVGPLGRDLAFRGVRRFARSSGFPWGGKSFSSANESQGRGINRVIALGEVFPFATHFGPSAIDGKPCLILDYDQPENPWLIRQIHDELRQVGPGIFLGPAMWKARPAPKLVLYFALEAL